MVLAPRKKDQGNKMEDTLYKTIVICFLTKTLFILRVRKHLRQVDKQMFTYKSEIKPIFLTPLKVNSKCIKDHSVKPKSWKLLEVNIIRTLQENSGRCGLLNSTAFTHDLRLTVDK